MPRSGGVYTLPNPPFTSGTTVSSSVTNGNFSDIAAALTDSVAADGQTTMTGPLVHSNGSAAAPAVTFASDKTTGIYLVSSGQLGVTLGGSLRATLTASALLTSLPVGSSSTGAQQLPTGTTGQRPTASAGMVRWNSTTSELETYDGTAWVAVSGQSGIQFVIDGGGQAIVSGVKGFLPIQYGFLINQVTMLADQSGSIEVDIWKAAFASFPPTSGNSITASDIPTISSAQKMQDSTLTGWTTQINAGDVLAFNVVNNATSITRVTVALQGKKT